MFTDEKWCFMLAYHMYGADIGTLNISKRSPTGETWLLWQRYGNQGHLWHQVSLEIDAGQFQIVISASKGKGPRDHIALDDLQLDKCSRFRKISLHDPLPRCLLIMSDELVLIFNAFSSGNYIKNALSTMIIPRIID